MYPFDIEDVEEEEEVELCEYEVNFTTRQLTGRMITGAEAIKQWAYIALSTDRYMYTQYTWEHGGELSDLVGENYTQDLLETEVKRIIEDCLFQNEYITGIENLEVIRDNSKLEVNFKLETTYGEEDMSIVV